jgi:hypothetical protein
MDRGHRKNTLQSLAQLAWGPLTVFDRKTCSIKIMLALIQLANSPKYTVNRNTNKHTKVDPSALRRGDRALFKLDVKCLSPEPSILT